MTSNLQSPISNLQKGQTLIETLAALFILVMGITASVGLAVYAFNSSTGIVKQIVATGLAREAIEAIRNARDTNWLKDDLEDNCYDYVTGNNEADCYKQWLQPSGANGSGTEDNKTGFDLNYGGGNQEVRITFDPDPDNRFWRIRSDNSRWGLDDSIKAGINASNSNFAGFYYLSNYNNGVTHGTSEYYRKIIINQDQSTSPYRNNLELLKVTAYVWWTDKKCPRVADWPGLGKCSIALETYLTNWKNY